jgi:hypothetical protein
VASPWSSASGAAGLAIAVYAAWITDVADVNAILRAVT